MRTHRLISLLLTVVLVLSSVSFAGAAEPRASEHLSRYSCYIEAIGDGNIDICFDAYGTALMTSIGATKIVLQQSRNGTIWLDVETFLSTDYPEMLSSGVAYYLSSVPYSGTAGMQYRAYVTVCGSIGNTSTSRTVLTTAVTAY